MLLFSHTPALQSSEAKHPLCLMEQHLKYNSIESIWMSLVWMRKESLNSCAFSNTLLFWNSKKKWCENRISAIFEVAINHIFAIL